MPRNKSEHTNQINSELDTLKNGEIKGAKIDLTKIKINTLAMKIGLLSEDVKMYMYPFNSKRYYALNDRTINLLLKGDIGMSATNSETAEVITDSDKEVVDLINVEKEIELSIVDKNTTRAGGPFFPHLNITMFDSSKYGIFKTVDRHKYSHNCLCLALQAGGLSDGKLQELILSLRNRHIHKCDLENVIH